MSQKIKQAFASQKCAARRRGILFLMTFEQWTDVWKSSGVFHLRGRKRSQYCMARFQDQGFYEVGNVRIITNEENHAEQAHPSFEHSAEARGKMSRSHKGKIISQETKERMRISRTGKKHSEETKAKIAKAHLGIRPNKTTREKLRKRKQSLPSELRA